MKKFLKYAAISISAVLLALAILSLISPVRVNGVSMQPTLEDGQFAVAVNPCLKEIRIGGIVIFKSEATKNLYYIKRVEGVPGDTVQIIDGVLYRNGEAVHEDLPAIENPGAYTVPYTLGEDEYFVLGDNRAESWDSRFIGPVCASDIFYVLLS